MQYSCKLRGLTVLVGVSVAAFALGVIAQPAGAQDVKTDTAAPSAATTPLPPAKKTTRSTYKPYFVEFRARSAATYGHMYVLYGQVNGRNEIVKSDIAGLHPAGDRNNCENCSVFTWSLGHFLFVPSETGASDGDLEEKYVTARYRVMVDAATFKKVSAHISKLKADPPLWNALWSNCVSFGNGVAGTMDLKTPGMIWLEPKDYVERLRELNGGAKQGPLKDAPRGASVSSLGSSSAAVPASPAATPAAAPASAPTTTPASSAIPTPPQKPKKQPVAAATASTPADVASSPPPGTAYGTPN
jgi:hypothetical protein